MKRKGLSRSVKAQAQFLTWLQQDHPELYSNVVGKILDQSAAKRVDQLGFHGDVDISPATTEQSLWSKIAAGVAAAGTTFLTLKNQRDAMKINLARAQQGLPPIDSTDTGPVLRTQIDLDPEVIKELTKGAGLQFNKILLIAGAALAAFFIFK